ncbi:hypothetical protein M0D21_14975 [Aquimarina sp. D1M17]|uniref:hypothetical protein n=1 Tax=Aquimarina acroporae TaxID=2937283 RepID=UPI0020BEAE36|nr:hypothetical protein [Aquimarina acroporae]MCK8522879.1 hypothetical protein [Aquimarina acroporae]
MKKKNLKKLQLSREMVAKLKGGIAHPMGEYKERVHWYVGTRGRNTCFCEF